MDHRKKIFIGTGVLAAAWMMLFTATLGGFIGYYVATRFPNALPGLTTTTSTGKVVQVTREDSAIISVVDSSSPSVVSIVGKGIDPFSGNFDDQSAGTGFIVDPSGVVVTNAHVVSDIGSIFTVVTKDKKTFTAKNISSDPINDIAFLRIEGSSLPALTLGDSSALKVGQSVVAIGNALGKFDNTVSTGVVSGLGRRLNLSASESFEGLIQTDAAINPGNSGGPLLNLVGEAIGVNFAKAGAENIGFAIPSDTVKTILSNYLANGRIIRPFLGVGSRIITKDSATLNNLPEGALIISVSAGSAAEKAGLRRNDIIIELSGQKISEEFSLAKAISSKKVGDQVVLKIWRGGEVTTVSATLAAAP
ncbi:MAG TPA: trypsin-like peptidase domain-containing protein [Patescibacteria group bacterium]|nr:trypsin-like peptidase domain-containing protein [Patescibacteria group bacterium]